MSINASVVYEGQTISVNISEFNTLDQQNNVTKGGDWQIPVALSSCPNTSSQPFGIALYQGRYTMANVTQGTQLQIFPVTPCPDYVRLVTGYDFQPESDLALILPGSGLSPIAATVVIASSTSGAVSQSAPHSPGLYTLVSADEWGALAFLYFEVTGSPPTGTSV